MHTTKTNQKRIVLVLFFALVFSGGVVLGRLSNNNQKESIMAQASKGKVVNILLMGIDARSPLANSRSDTMILASMDTRSKKIVMVWVPRDTRIELSPGHQDKINDVNYMKGPDAACETVAQLLDTKVDYYIVVNFWGFSKIINTLGGVTINVESDMRHFDPNPLLNINLAKGVQHLNGENSLKYVRYRSGVTADIGRTQDQAHFMKALASQLLQATTILKLPQLVPELMDCIRTNISMDDMVYLLAENKDFGNNEIITQTLPGYPLNERDGASYWEADQRISHGIIESLLAGKRFEVMQTPPKGTPQERVVLSNDKKAKPLGATKNNTKSTTNNNSQQSSSHVNHSIARQPGNNDQTGSQPPGQNLQPVTRPSNSSQNNLPNVKDSTIVVNHTNKICGDSI